MPSIYSSARPELDRSPVSRDHACMISSFVRARPLARPQVLALFTVGDVYASVCRRGAYVPFSAQRRSRALFGL